ncbi:MAG: hypothetical protein Q8861_02070 [Bacteroidota bacterium]|nr:hypothetical protein [Bacteroidota bacterium]
MKTKKQILEEAIEIYAAILLIMRQQKTDYCQSWWLNKHNFSLQSNLDSKSIVRRCHLLVRLGYLIIDREKTSTAMGTSFKLTEKQLL